MPWSLLELAENHFAEDWNTVTPVQSDGRDVEDTENSGIRAETDEVDGNAPEDGDPDGQDRGAGHG